MLEGLFKSAHNSCKKKKKKKLSTHARSSFLSLTPLSICSASSEPATQDLENSARKWGLRGSRSLVLRLVWGKCFQCARTQCALWASRLSAPSMGLLLWGCCWCHGSARPHALPGWCWCTFAGAGGTQSSCSWAFVGDWTWYCRKAVKVRHCG